MLTVAAPSSGTEADRAAFRLFTLWDSGISVLGGVAAFRPYDEPGTKRRQSDVVLLVPDGIIVLRLVGSQRQSGPIVAHPDGAWSIGGEVLRIAGGGSNPLPALRNAQASVASTLRASGLDPGRVAMLVAVGAGEPVEPGDGQLDDGVIVCPMSEEGLAVGVRRAAALTAAADVRQWTTADVKAALSSLGASGRVPAVEELNSEGFMYSPYILRRPDLVASASAVAASAAAETAAVVATQPDQKSGAPITAPGDPQAAPKVPAPMDADAGLPTRAAVVEQSSDSAGDSDSDLGLAALLGGQTADEDRGSSANADAKGSTNRASRQDAAAVEGGAAPAVGVDAGGGGYDQPAPEYGGEPGGRRRGPLIAAVLAVLLLVAAAIYFGVGLLGSDDTGGGSNADAGGGSSAEASPSPEPRIQQVGERSYVLAVARAGESCTGNAYGQVADYFVTTDCAALDRELYTTDIDTVGVVVSVARVTMPDAATAEALKALTDSNGTGNVADLLRAGERIPNGPTELSDAAYASDLDGVVLTIVEAAWLDPDAPGDEQALEQLATEALALEPPD